MKKDNIKEFIEETIAKEFKKLISESASNEVYIIKNEDGDPVEQFKTEEEANKALEAYKTKNPEQELIIEPGKELSFDELDKMSEKMENMENMNETSGKGHFTMEQVLKLAKKAGEFVLDAEDALKELCEMYGEKIPAKEVFDVLDDYDMPELKSKIKVKKVEAKEGNAFSGALAKAKEHGKDSFTVDGKEFDVEEEEGECMECGEKSMQEDDLEKLLRGKRTKAHHAQHDDVDMEDGAEEEQMDEEKMTCEKCGKDLCECGDMMESKKSLRLNESELVSLITKIVNESFPGATIHKAVHTGSGKQNSDSLTDVEKKIKDFLNFDGNDNPEFPNQIGGEVKARRADEEESEEVAAIRGGGLEDLAYDLDLTKETQDRHEKALKGDTTMGNSQDAANVIPSKLGEKIIKKVKRKHEEESKAPMYVKDAQPSTIVKESKIVSEEILRMKQMASYNKKTQ
jgi:hypothetical protein